MAQQKVKMEILEGKKSEILRGETIATLYNVLLAPDLCDQLFSIIMLINLIHTWFFYKGFCTVLFSDNEQNAVTLCHSAHRKHDFLVKMKKKWKSQNQNPNKKFYLGLLRKILGHRSTRSLLPVDTSNIWQDIDIRVDPELFCTFFQISTIN